MTPDKKRLIIFATAYHPFIGGVETAIQEIAKRLHGRFEIFVVTSRFSRGLPKREIRPECTLIRVGIGSKLDKWLLLFFGCYAAWRRIGDPRRTLLLGVDISQGALAASLCKTICPGASASFVFNIQYGEGDARLARGRFGMINLMLRWMLWRADEVTVISSYLGDVARRYGYTGRINTIHNGVSEEIFAPPEEKKPNTPRIVITTSRLVEKNGVDTLIRAIAVLKGKGVPVQCHILGDGPDRFDLEQLVGELGVTDEVVFLGSVPFEKVPPYLHDASVFVRVSRSEGMGVSFVEALAAGLPIVGTPVGGITDIITDGVTGLFVKVDDPEDAAEKIMRLLRDPVLSRSIVENGKKMIHERFRWDAIAEQYAEVFHRLQDSKRILIATGLFPPEIGGPATYSKLLEDELPEFGLAVVVLPFRMVRHLPKLLRHAAYFGKVMWRGIRADVIFAQDPVSVGLPAALAAFLLHKKFILKIVGDYAWEQGSQRFGVSDPLDEFLRKKYGWQVEMLRRLERWVARRAYRIVVPSEYLRGVVAQWGIPKERMVVIYNAFDPPARTVSRDEARKKLGLTGTILVSVGRLVPWKGFGALIQTISELQRDIPDIRLCIVGGGPEHDNLARKIRSMGLEERVVLKGNMSHEDVLALLAAGDVFVLNTRYEGFSHTLLEAMVMGIPVATTPAGGNKEIVSHEENGLLFEYDDTKGMRTAILRMVRDPGFARGLVGKAHEKVESFSTRRMLDGISDVLKTI